MAGIGHTDNFMADPQIVQRLQIKKYYTDIAPQDDNNRQLSQYFGLVYSRFNENATPNKRTLAERESLIRRYAAASIGRILPHRIPNFIGSWDLENPAEGLFEIYIEQVEGKDIYGTIEDALGSASFFGRYDPEEFINFWKEYEEPATLIGASNRTLVYSGTFKDGQYKGSFGANSMSMGRDFWLREF